MPWITVSALLILIIIIVALARWFGVGSLAFYLANFAMALSYKLPRQTPYHNETGAPTWSNRSKSMRVNTPFGHICNVYGLQLRIVATVLACLHACWPACRLSCLPTYLAPGSALLFRHMSSGRQSAKRLSAVRLNILFIYDGQTLKKYIIIFGWSQRHLDTF